MLHNAYADADDPTAVMKYVRDKIVEYNNSSGELPGTMSKISWILTAQTKTVVGMFEARRAAEEPEGADRAKQARVRGTRRGDGSVGM